MGGWSSWWFAGGLVVAGGIEGEVAEEFSGGRVDDADVEVLDEEQDVGSGVGSTDAEVVEVAVVAQGHGAAGVDDVVTDSVVGAVGGVARPWFSAHDSQPDLPFRNPFDIVLFHAFAVDPGIGYATPNLLLQVPRELFLSVIDDGVTLIVTKRLYFGDWTEDVLANASPNELVQGGEGYWVRR